ncbi:MAG: T9SS type A sorting domain-containing protein [Bacteroidales bacterium]
MKTTTLLLIMLTFFGTSRAQIYLEKTYTSSAELTELAVSGFKYYEMVVSNNLCRLYNMDHTAWKTISLNVPSGMYLYDIKFVSETLFNTDSKVELAYIYYSYDTTLLYYTYFTKVVNEDGMELLSIPGCAYMEIEKPGTNGTKLLAFVYDYSIVLWTVSTLVYSLPGDLPIGGIPLTCKENLKHSYPNPANDMVTIPYMLPDGVKDGEVYLYNGIGLLLGRYPVGSSLHELQIQISDFPRGIYRYQIKTVNGVASTGNFIHE